jgi:uncharacterized damage-inducible protein DinB
LERKKGRQRRYDVAALDGFRDQTVAWLAAALDELRERVYDQVIHLPQEAVDYVAAATGLSVGRLLLHLGWAEANWIRRLSGNDGPEDLRATLAAGALESFREAPPRTGPAAALVALCRRVRDEVTVPWLRIVAEPDAKVMEDGSSTRGVLMHLCWHWVYHSGHIGLLSFEAGYDYEWTVRRPLARP